VAIELRIIQAINARKKRQDMYGIRRNMLSVVGAAGRGSERDRWAISE